MADWDYIGRCVGITFGILLVTAGIWVPAVAFFFGGFDGNIRKSPARYLWDWLHNRPSEALS